MSGSKPEYPGAPGYLHTLHTNPPLWPEEGADVPQFQCPRCAHVGELSAFVPSGDPGQNTRQCPNPKCRTILKVAR